MRRRKEKNCENALIKYTAEAEREKKCKAHLRDKEAQTVQNTYQSETLVALKMQMRQERREECKIRVIGKGGEKDLWLTRKM